MLLAGQIVHALHIQSDLHPHACQSSRGWYLPGRRLQGNGEGPGDDLIGSLLQGQFGTGSLAINLIKYSGVGGPVVVQGKQIQLGTMRLQV